MFILGGILFILLALALMLWIKSPGKEEPITGADGKNLDGSISQIEKIKLGGVEQYLFIRGVDRTKPVMLFLHGGPGSPELAFMKNFNTDIEEDFVMVYWEQRGAGKSYSKEIPVESMNLTQFILDTRELSEYLAKRFNQEKIYLMGHSWGSLLGILTAYQYPELFYSYFGVGQVAHQYKGEKISFEWVKEQAYQRNDKAAVERLSKMNFPDSLAPSAKWIEFLLEERKYVIQFGGSIREMTGMWPMVKMVLDAKEYTITDKANYMKGGLFSLENLWSVVINKNLFVEIDSMQLPVYIFQGVYDYQTPYSVAKDFYDQLKAPQKEFFTFENSAHSPIMEEVDKFNSIVREKVKNSTVSLSK
jgi:pimeloyl-ACP methyl ester carboxylesterase